MKQVIILKGLPASGKTTWAKGEMKQHPGKYKRINKDELRTMLDCGNWSRDNEKFILKMRDQAIMAALEAGKHVIVDDTNLHPKHEENIRELIKGLASVHIIFFKISVEDAIKRDLERPVSVGEKVIRGMYKQFLAEKSSKVKYIEGLPECIICDIDGTLALMGDRSPYDASKCMLDQPHRPIIDIIRTFKVFRSVEIILFSGREEKHREITERWLEKYGVECNGLLHMRATDDTRKDSIVKQEMYKKVIEGKYNVLFVLDDRNQVVEMWRGLGLTCLQVAEGDF